MRRLDRMAVLLSGKPAKLQIIGRASIVAFCVFFALVLVLVLSDTRLESSIATTTTATIISAKSFASTSPPQSYTANKGELLGISAYAEVKVVSARKFDSLVSTAASAQRKRKMIDLTQSPESNSMQVLLNTWTRGSFSPIHRHPDYSEAFVVLSGVLAFFTFDESGNNVTCTLLKGEGAHAASASASAQGLDGASQDRAIIIEKNVWHGMTAWFPPEQPASASPPSDAAYTYASAKSSSPSTAHTPHAVIFEISGHVYDKSKQTKELAPFAPSLNSGLDGDPIYFEKILKHCRW